MTWDELKQHLQNKNYEALIANKDKIDLGQFRGDPTEIYRQMKSAIPYDPFPMPKTPALDAGMVGGVMGMGGPAMISNGPLARHYMLQQGMIPPANRGEAAIPFDRLKKKLQAKPAKKPVVPPGAPPLGQMLNPLAPPPPVQGNPQDMLLGR